MSTLTQVELPVLSAVQVAEYFIKIGQEDNNPLTPLQLIKLTYIAHGVTLARAGEPLFFEPVEAWKLGPVIASVYHAYKDFVDSPIDRAVSPLAIREIEKSEQVTGILKSVYRKFGTWTGSQLTNWSHIKGSPWDEIWNRRNGKDIRKTQIPNSLIRDYFASHVVKTKS